MDAIGKDYNCHPQKSSNAEKQHLNTTTTNNTAQIIIVLRVQVLFIVF